MPLLNTELSSSDLFLGAINDKPGLKLRTGTEWHIGNVNFIDSLHGSFAVGKTTKTTVERFDKESGDFIDQIDDSGPYTRVIFDCGIGLLGIAKKSKLAPDAKAVARKLQSLFEQSELIILTGVEVKVDYIPDPEDFIDKIREAYSIKKFRATFTGPNPVDADELFQKPLSVYCQEIGADRGALEVQGASLNEETVEEIAKSTAATGNTATARIIQDAGGKSIPITMAGNAVVVAVDENAPTNEVIQEMQKEYARVRG